MIEIVANNRVIKGNNATSVVNEAEGVLGSYEPDDSIIPVLLEDFRIWAKETTIDQARIKREAYLTPGKAMVYEQKQREVRRYDAGERDPTNLPYMARRATRLSQTPLQVRNTWKAQMDSIEASDLDTEDDYEIAIEAIESAVSIGEIKTALATFLA